MFSYSAADIVLIVIALGAVALVPLAAPWVLALLLVRLGWSYLWRRGIDRAIARGSVATAEAKLRRARVIAQWLVLPALQRSASMQLGNLLRQQERFEAAIAVYEEALARPGRGRAASIQQAVLRNNLGLALQAQSKFEDAECEFLAAEAIWKERGARQASRAVTLENLAELRLERGQGEPAIAALRQAAEVRAELPERNRSKEIEVATRLARVLEGQGGTGGHDAELERLWRTVLEFHTESKGVTSPARIESLAGLLRLCDRQKREDEYHELFGEWIACRLAAPRTDAIELAGERLRHCERRLALGFSDEAEAAARALLTELPSSAVEERVWAHQISGKARAAMRNWNEAEAAYLRALEAEHGGQNLSGGRHVEVLIGLAEARTQRRQLLAAQETYEQALAFLKANAPPDHPWIGWTEAQLQRLWMPGIEERPN
ncbi:MAG TPA: tetratricopeptide repeat protein [Terriglobales bacterium]|nr:tetratricopeptide repeat protein [Terriglobales bacterium]